MQTGMNPQRLRRLEDLYHATLEREPGQRQAFLAAECGSDTELLREIQELLLHSCEGALDRSPLEALRWEGLIEGSRLGPYQILTRIGAGGMGEVYRATDTASTGP